MTTTLELTNAAIAEPITKPGVYSIPTEAYHADPVKGGSLSHSGARKLRECPAKFAYWREHPEIPSDDFDFGHAAHRLVLGDGADLVVIEADSWRTNAAKDAKAEAHATGKIPVLITQLLVVEAMAKALRAHPIAAALFSPGSGAPEQTLVWRDERTGVMCRALIDWLPHKQPGRMIVPDYKTTKNASNDAISRSAADYEYHTQADWYLSGIRALGLDANPAFVLVAQEKTPPYLVNVAQLDPVAMRIARDENRESLRVYAECTAAGQWPGYSSEVELIALPPWVENKHRKDIW